MPSGPDRGRKQAFALTISGCGYQVKSHARNQWTRAFIDTTARGQASGLRNRPKLTQSSGGLRRVTRRNKRYAARQTPSQEVCLEIHALHLGTELYLSLEQLLIDFRIAVMRRIDLRTMGSCPTWYSPSVV
jgi:hypothetical protein